jgi:hypothetical protein
MSRLRWHPFCSFESRQINLIQSGTNPFARKLVVNLNSGQPMGFSIVNGDGIKLTLAQVVERLKMK